MMTDEELDAFRKNIAINESSTVWLERKALVQIDEQAGQIATVKAICIKERFWQIWKAGECQTVERATQKAKDQLAKEYPEIFAEE